MLALSIAFSLLDVMVSSRRDSYLKRKFFDHFSSTLHEKTSCSLQVTKYFLVQVKCFKMEHTHIIGKDKSIFPNL